MSSYHPSRRAIYKIYMQKPHLKSPDKIDYVTQTLLDSLTFTDVKDRESAKESLRRVCYEFKRRTKKCSKLDDPKSKHSDWLDEAIHFKEPTLPTGRPQEPFLTLSDSTKRRRVEVLRKSASTAELAFATEMNARADGNEDAAKLLHTMFQTGNAESTSQIRAAFLESLKTEKMKLFSPGEALALFINVDLSRDEYQTLRNEMEARHAKGLLPRYKIVQEAGNACCVSEESVEVTESSVKINLQALLDLTLKRLLQKYGNNLHDRVSETGEKTTVRLCMVSKWGFDGSSGHARYKQKTTGEYTDGSIFLTCLVPLDVHRVGTDMIDRQLWLNPAPSSTRYCRLVSFEFMKETIQSTQLHFDEMQKEISALVPTETEIGNLNVVCTHELYPSMVDGKVCSAVAGTSSSRCHVCGAYPVDMNKVEQVKNRPVSKETFKFGLSPLHFRIRSLEAILHVAYKVENKKWRAETDAEKRSVEQRKKKIQDLFWNSTGLHVDFVRQGHGKSNDGNTARRFFRNPQLASDITEVNLDLITRLGVISEVLSSGRKINLARFDTYCLDTAKVFVREYPWYHMPQSLHKVLIHGAHILAEFPLPMGVFTEEAQESRNKDLRKAREEHARKTSRVDTNRDVARRFTITSDPIISGYIRTRTAAIPPTADMAALLL